MIKPEKENSPGPVGDGSRAWPRQEILEAIADIRACLKKTKDCLDRIEEFTDNLKAKGPESGRDRRAAGKREKTREDADLRL